MKPPLKVSILKGLQNAMDTTWQKYFNKIPTLDGDNSVMTTGAATATQYAKLITFSYPATNNVTAKCRLLLTPIADGEGYGPILMDVIAHQSTSGLDTTKSKIDIINNAQDCVQHDSVDLVTATASNGTDMMLWMQSDVVAKYAVQVLSAEFDTGVSAAYNDAATWTATNPTSGAAASVTSDWAGHNVFTPTPSFGGASVGMTFSTHYGEYQIIRGVCNLKINLTFTAKGTSTGVFTIPLPVNQSSSFAAMVGGSVRFRNMATTFQQNNVSVIAFNNNLYVQYGTGAGGVENIFDTDFNNNSIVEIDLTYMV